MENCRISERTQEALIESLKEAPVKVRVRVDDQDDFVETVLPGSTLARSKHVLQELGREEGSVVAIDFGNVVVDEDGTLQGQDELYTRRGSSSISHEDEYPVTRQTNIYSLWHYMGFAADQQQNATTTTNACRLQIFKWQDWSTPFKRCNMT